MEVIPGCSEDRFDCVALLVGDVVSVHSIAIFEATDDRLDGRAAFHLAFDGRRDSLLLLCGEDTEFVNTRRVRAPVSGIFEDALERIPRWGFPSPG